MVECYSPSPSHTNQETMKIFSNCRHPFNCCFSTTTASSSSTPIITIKNRLSSSFTDLFKHQEPNHNNQEDQEDSLIDAAASLYHSHSPSHHPRTNIIGTIYGRRHGHVTFCVQSDPSIPPPFLFELSVHTHHLAKEMNSGLLRIALECRRVPQHHATMDPSLSSSRRSSLHVWKAYCNGRKVGYAVKRKPSSKDIMILQTMKPMSAGAGVLLDDGDEKGEVLYMRACYERVVGSRDSVSYHLINPGGSAEAQELSVFLLRTG